MWRRVDDGRATTVEALVSTFIEAAPVGFAFVDTDLRYEMVNARMAQFNGLSPEDHLDRPVAEVVPQLGRAVAAQVRGVLESGRSRTHVELRADVDGTAGATRTWQAAFYPIDDDGGGGPLGVGVVMVEVTGRKARELQLETLHRQQRAISSRLQRGLLPPALPTIDGFSVAARYIAGADQLQVGGDWYDVVDVSAHDAALVVGDVVGHDLEAALAMGQLRSALAGLSHAHSDVADVLSHLDVFASNTPATFGSTLFYGRLDPTAGTLTYSSAGHLPPMLVDGDGRCRHLDDARGPVLGIAGARPSAQVDLGRGDTVVAFTDGLVERRGEVLDDGLRRVRELLERIASLDVDRLADALVGAVGAEHRTDDIAVLVVRCDR